LVQSRSQSLTIGAIRANWKLDLSAHQILFFIGLREMARRYPDFVSVPYEIGGRLPGVSTRRDLVTDSALFPPHLVTIAVLARDL